MGYRRDILRKLSINYIVELTADVFPNFIKTRGEPCRARVETGLGLDRRLLVIFIKRKEGTSALSTTDRTILNFAKSGITVHAFSVISPAIDTWYWPVTPFMLPGSTRR